MSGFPPQRMQMKPGKEQAPVFCASPAATTFAAATGWRCAALAGRSALLDVFGGIELACLVFEHHRNAVADAKCQPVGLADEFLLGLAVEQPPLADRAPQDVKQSCVH